MWRCRLHVKVYSKREKELVEEVARMCVALQRLGLGTEIHVEPLPLNLTKHLLGRWIPLPLIGKPFRWLSWLLKALGGGFLYEKTSEIADWFQTLEVLRLASVQEGDELTPEQATTWERWIAHEIARVHEQLGDLVQDVNRALSRRRAMYDRIAPASEEARGGKPEGREPGPPDS